MAVALVIQVRSEGSRVWPMSRFGCQPTGSDNLAEKQVKKDGLMRIHVHAPDGGSIPGTLCGQDGDLTTVRQDVTCPDCDDILDADYTASDWPRLIRGFAAQLRSQQELWMRARSPRRSRGASRRRTGNGARVSCV